MIGFSALSLLFCFLHFCKPGLTAWYSEFTYSFCWTTPSSLHNSFSFFNGFLALVLRNFIWKGWFSLFWQFFRSFLATSSHYWGWPPIVLWRSDWRFIFFSTDILWFNVCDIAFLFNLFVFFSFMRFLVVIGSIIDKWEVLIVSFEVPINCPNEACWFVFIQLELFCSSLSTCYRVSFLTDLITYLLK